MKRQDRNTLIASVVGVLFFIGLAFEIAGFRTDLWHSISWYSHAYPILRWGIAAAMGIVLVWWIHHSGHPIPKLIRRLYVKSN